MKAYGMATLGADAVMRYTPNGDPVADLSLAFRLGKKDKDGQYMTQWVRAGLFGKRAEALAPYLVKGSKHAFALRDIRVEEFTGKDGSVKVSLRADVDDVELGSKVEAKPKPEPSARGGGSSGFDDLNDDIPW